MTYQAHKPRPFTLRPLLWSGVVVLSVAWPAVSNQAAPAPRDPYLTAVEKDRCAKVPRSRRKKKRYARKHYKLGIRLVAQNKLAAGMTALKCSFTAHAHYNTYYNYAKIAERLDRFEEAIDAYKKYLKLNRRAKDQTDIEEKIEILEKAIKERERKLEAKRKEEEVRRLAEKLAKEKLAAKQEAEAEKRAAAEAKRHKKEAEMQANLARLKTEQTRQKADLERKTIELSLARKRRRFTTAAWIIGGAGVAALVISGITGGLALKEKSTVEGGGMDEPWRGDLADAYRRNETYSVVSYSTMGVGALLTGGAAVLYWLSTRITGKERPTARRIRVLPGVSKNGASVRLGLDF
jgi:tetratricopeptide (TPR) repeat protein